MRRRTFSGCRTVSFGQPLDTLFQSIEPDPVGAASIAQVHRGVTTDGRTVAIKVLRPGIRERFARDIQTYEWAAAHLEAMGTGEVRRLRPALTIANFKRWTLRELDLRREAASASELSEAMRGTPRYMIPQVDWDRTNGRVMTIEWIDGTKISRTEELIAQGHDLPDLADAQFAHRLAAHRFAHRPQRGGEFVDRMVGRHVLRLEMNLGDAAIIARGQPVEDFRQPLPRLPVDVAALGCDYYAFSGHKLYGPTGIGVLWSDKLDTLPPWQGGGSMIDRVTFERTTYAAAPTRFEAGTPAIIEAIGLAAAVDYVVGLGVDAIHAHEVALVGQLREALARRNSITLFGPENSAGIVSFAMAGVHPHDIGTILDESGVAIRAGHHCAQPLMAHLGVPATARASFGLYSNADDVTALIEGLARVERIFG